MAEISPADMARREETCEFTQSIMKLIAERNKDPKTRLNNAEITLGLAMTVSLAIEQMIEGKSDMLAPLMEIFFHSLNINGCEIVKADKDQATDLLKKISESETPKDIVQ